MPYLTSIPRVNHLPVELVGAVPSNTHHDIVVSNCETVHILAQVEQIYA